MTRRSRGVRVTPRLRSVAWCLSSVALLQGCATTERAALVVRDVQIVDVARGVVIGAQTVVVNDGSISAILPAGDADRVRGDIDVDGAGRYLVPGLADVHVHLQSASELEQFLLYGVTAVVNMAGDAGHLAMRDAVADGTLRGPRILTAGPTLDGPKPTNPLFVDVEPDRARAIVDWIDGQGYDLVKVYQQLDAATLRAIIHAARDRNLTTAGHVSRRAGLTAVLDAGLDVVAHGEELSFGAYRDTANRYDRTAIPTITDAVASAGATVTPMLHYLETIPAQVVDLDRYLSAEPMQLADAATRQSFDSRQGWFQGRDDPARFVAQIEDLAAFVAALTYALHERDVPLVLGTDAGFGGALPGHDVHDELDALVRAGLSERDALMTGTIDAGQYLNAIDPGFGAWGAIRPGYAADFLLIAGNPLDDIAATRSIEGVAAGGRWLDASELGAIATRLRDRQCALLPLARRFETALVDGDADLARELVGAVPARYGGTPLVSAANCIFLGYRHYYGGRRALAGALYEICASMHPAHAPLWIHIARARQSADDVAGAIEAYEKAAVLNPWYGDPVGNLSRLNRQ